MQRCKTPKTNEQTMRRKRNTSLQRVSGFLDFGFLPVTIQIAFVQSNMCCGCNPLGIRAFRSLVVVFSCLMVVMSVFSVIGFVDVLKTYYTYYFACIIGAQGFVAAILGFCSVGLMRHANEWVPKGIAIAHVVITATLLLMIFPASIVSGINWGVWIGTNCFSGSTVCSNASTFGARVGIALGVSTGCFFIFTILYLVVAIKWLLRLMLDQSWRNDFDEEMTMK